MKLTILCREDNWLPCQSSNLGSSRYVTECYLVVRIVRWGMELSYVNMQAEQRKLCTDMFCCQIFQLQ